jgi:hypothetical protein
MAFDDAARARIARGWLNSSLDQPAYAAQHGISTRTLRDWVCRYGGGRRPHAQLRAAIIAAVEQLQNVLTALDAEAAAGSAAVPEDNPESFEEFSRHVVSAGKAAQGEAKPAGVLVLPAAHADGTVGEQDQGPLPGNEATTVLDFEALRKRAAERRAASGAPKRNPFLDWDDV